MSTGRWMKSSPHRRYGLVVNWIRRRSLDIFLVVLGVAEGLALAASGGGNRLAAAVLAAAAAFVLVWRRRPLLVSVLALVLLGTALRLASTNPSLIFFGLMATFAVVAAINTTRDGAIAWVCGAVAVVVAAGSSGTKGWLADAALTLALCTVMWVAGWLVSRRTRQAEVM